MNDSNLPIHPSIHPSICTVSPIEPGSATKILSLLRWGVSWLGDFGWFFHPPFAANDFTVKNGCWIIKIVEFNPPRLGCWDE